MARGPSVPAGRADPRRKVTSYEEEVKGASLPKKEARPVEDVPPVHLPQRREPRQVRRLWECATASPKPPEMPSSFRKAKLGRGSRAFLSRRTPKG